MLTSPILTVSFYIQNGGSSWLLIKGSYIDIHIHDRKHPKQVQDWRKSEFSILCVCVCV